MRIDPEDLRRHYASLPDGALMSLDRAELTDLAKAIYDNELAQRKLRLATEEEGLDEPIRDDTGLGLEDDDDETDGMDVDSGPSPDWLEDAACACSFAMRSANAHSPSAVNARLALRRAGVPCHAMMSEEERPTADPSPIYAVRLLVPGGLALYAMSILDRDVFNEDQEAEWRANFEVLSDDELLALSPEALCAGLLDKVARLKRAYGDEIARRKLSRRG
jgi:hypothetical protein